MYFEEVTLILVPANNKNSTFDSMVNFLFLVFLNHSSVTFPSQPALNSESIYLANISFLSSINFSIRLP